MSDRDHLDLSSTLPPALVASFSEIFPLPFRILFLASLGVLAWGVNLHILSLVGIDTGQVLDVRIDDFQGGTRGGATGGGAVTGLGLGISSEGGSSSTGGGGGSTGGGSILPIANISASPIVSSIRSLFLHPSKLYPPVYSIGLVYSAWSLLGWVVYRALILSGVGLNETGELGNLAGWLPFVWLVMGIGSVFIPWNGLYRREREVFMRAIRRCLNPNLLRAVPFSDVILADVLTSFAKVLGDTFVVGYFVIYGGGTEGWGRSIMVPLMIALPYMIRFRQCLSEFLLSPPASSYSASSHSPCPVPSSNPTRSLLNAVKYASAFPVILFSALLGPGGDPYDLADGEEEALRSSRWIGTVGLFRLWVLAVLVNSLYSFWWDVTNDWGLSLLIPSGWDASASTIFSSFRSNPSSTTSRTRSSSRAGTPHLRTKSMPAGRMLATVNNPASGPSPRSGASAGGAGPSSSTSNSSWNGWHVPRSPSHSSISLGNLSGSSTAKESPPTTDLDEDPVSKRTQQHYPHTPHTPSYHRRALTSLFLPSDIPIPFLRPVLLLPDPLIYYLAISLDLILRFTWSLKLSSHLHEIHEIESGIFLMEALEVARRWMWVFLRVEWEAVRKGDNSAGKYRHHDRDDREESEELFDAASGSYVMDSRVPGLESAGGEGIPMATMGSTSASSKVKGMEGRPRDEKVSLGM